MKQMINDFLLDPQQKAGPEANPAQGNFQPLQGQTFGNPSTQSWQQSGAQSMMNQQQGVRDPSGQYPRDLSGQYPKKQEPPLSQQGFPRLTLPMGVPGYKSEAFRSSFPTAHHQSQIPQQRTPQQQAQLPFNSHPQPHAARPQIRPQQPAASMARPSQPSSFLGMLTEGEGQNNHARQPSAQQVNKSFHSDNDVVNDAADMTINGTEAAQHEEQNDRRTLSNCALFKKHQVYVNPKQPEAIGTPIYFVRNSFCSDVALEDYDIQGSIS